MARPGNATFDRVIRTGAAVIAVLGAVGVLLSLLHLLLPLLPGLGLVCAGGWLWQQHHHAQVQQEKTRRAIFYQLLRDHQGQMTLLDFAMAAQLPAIVARQYLSDRAKEFAARFEVTEQGDVVYVFSTVQFAQSQSGRNPGNGLPVGAQALIASTVSASATQTQLAQRLGVTASTLSRKKRAPDLAVWTRQRDPDGIGWSYHAESRRFFPVEDASKELV